MHRGGLSLESTKSRTFILSAFDSAVIYQFHKSKGMVEVNKDTAGLRYGQAVMLPRIACPMFGRVLVCSHKLKEETRPFAWDAKKNKGEWSGKTGPQ